MPLDLASISIEAIQDWIADCQRDSDKRSTRKKYVEGDHYQDGSGWKGPMPEIKETDPTEYNQVKYRIERHFASQNVIGEVTSRHVDAVVGSEPEWKITYRGQENERIEQEIRDRNADMQEWWDEKNLLNVLQQATFRAKWSSRSVIRLRIPLQFIKPTYIDPETNQVYDEPAENLQLVNVIQARDRAHALSMIHIEMIDETQACVYTDPDTLERYGAYIYSKDDGTNVAEISWVDETGLTNLAKIERDSFSAVRYDLKGMLFHHEIQLDSIVTDQVIQLQNMINKSLTFANANLDWTGFLERIFLNAQPPTELVDDPERPGMKRRIAAPYKSGPATTQFIQGTILKDEQGRQIIANPDVVFREPNETKLFVGSKDLAYRAILSEVSQMHALIAGDAMATGESRRQATSEFLRSLKTTKTNADVAGRWMLTSSYHLAASMVDDVTAAEYRISFQSRIDPGPVPSEDLRMYSDMKRDDLLTHETMLYKTGIQDVDTELRELHNAPEYQLKLLSKQINAAQSITMLNIDLETALRVVGVSDDTIREIMQGYTEPEPIDITEEEDETA